MADKIDLEKFLTDDKEKIDVASLSFEDGLKLLDVLVSRVEAGSLPLERSIMSYEKGSQLVEHLKALLSRAEERLKLLDKGDKLVEV